MKLRSIKLQKHPFHRWHTLTLTKTGAFHVHLFFFGSLQCCVKWGDLHLPSFALPLSYSPLIYKHKRGCFKNDSPSVFEKALWDKYPKYTPTQQLLQGLLRHRVLKNASLYMPFCCLFYPFNFSQPSNIVFVNIVEYFQCSKLSQTLMF